MENDIFKPLRVRDLSEEDRPREKAVAAGIDSLSDAELLAVLLGGGLPGVSVISLSQAILSSCDNSMIRLAKMPIKEMTRKFKGVGTAKAVTLAAAFELGRRLQAAREREAMKEKCRVTSSDIAYSYIRKRVELLDYEEFWVLFLSRGNIIKGAQCISQGGTAATVVDVKLLMRHAIDNLADAIILVHNHPSGTLFPSREDDELTKRVKDASRLLEIRLLDHLIVTAEGYYSYQDNGKL